MFQEDKSCDRCISLHGGVNKESSIQVSFVMSNYKYVSPFRRSAVRSAVSSSKIREDILTLKGT